MMRNWFFFMVATAIGCSSNGTSNSTTQRPSTGGTAGSGTGGAGSGTGGASGGSGGSAATGGSGGATGGSGGSTGGSGGSTGGAGGSTAGSGGSTGGAAGSPDAGRDAGGGGGGDASPRPDASLDEQQSCTNFADAFCNRLQTCSSFVMTVLYGDVATCKQRWVLSCLPNYNVRGTSASPAKTSSCAQTLTALACDKFLLGDFGTACTPSAGTLAQGAACGDDAQCASTFCARSPTSACGTCQPVTNPGDPCVQGSCSVSTNTICPANTTTCVKPKAGQVGDACVGQEECDVGHQVGCNTATSKQCIALMLASSGGTCGANGNPLNPTSVTVCPAGGTCSLPLAGMCTPFAADGQSCSTMDTGAHCMQPAKCVGGRCVVPDPSTCN